MSDDYDFDAAVRKGAELLDVARPGWAAEVALDRLSMASCDRCILGQLYGDYARGFREAVASQPKGMEFWDADYGFTVPIAMQVGNRDRRYRHFARLADAWRREVRARTEAAV